jgi:ABC-2 type transport system ATP-binding protein
VAHAARRTTGVVGVCDRRRVLTVDGLRRVFGGLVVFEDVTFTVAAGEAVCLLGPNGAGKTTLLRCIVGADRPDGGDVLLDGKRLDETDPWTRSVLASALDDIDFFPDLSVAEHLELLAFAHGAPADDVAGVLVDLGLAGARDQLPVTLSSGQRRRLALASCFVRPRRLLVLDEPEQRLDTAGRAWLADRLLAEKADGVAVLVASHDPDLVEAVADATVTLDRPA